jgi:hypothetical protein
VKAVRRALILVAVALALAAPAAAQTAVPKKPAARPATRPATKPATKPVAPRRVTEDADVACPNVLGIGVGSELQFCDVLTGRNPADGMIIHLPPHRGVLTLTFDLHNRHTYSEEAARAGRAYANYTATIGALTMDGTLLSRAVVRSEFRSAKDLLDRIAGGAGPMGLKAVAPVGTERISIDVPENVDAVSLLGEKLTVLGRNGTETFTAGQRPIAAVSNVVIDYQPSPKARVKPAAKPPIKKK